jgi:transcriptional regulator with GAF, ATPase, and Fis domain
MSALARYPWPGNIRELQNVIERAVILSTGTVLTVRGEELGSPNQAPTSPAVATADAGHQNPARSLGAVLETAERERILATLQQSNWVVAGRDGAAARLGLKRTTLQSRMRKFGIKVSRSGGDVGK